jgi:hypothetical protein
MCFAFKVQLLFCAAAALQEVLDAADVELGFNYPCPVVTQEVSRSTWPNIPKFTAATSLHTNTV